MKKIITAGLAVRSQIRTFFLREGIDFTEDKGWIESDFYLRCSDEKWRFVVKTLQEYERRMNVA
jgi:hypothetical protein